MLIIHFDICCLGVCHNILYSCQCNSPKSPHYLFLLSGEMSFLYIQTSHKKKKKKKKFSTRLFLIRIISHALNSPQSPSESLLPTAQLCASQLCSLNSFLPAPSEAAPLHSVPHSPACSHLSKLQSWLVSLPGRHKKSVFLVHPGWCYSSSKVVKIS